MNVLWVACNTSSLNPMVANFTELAFRKHQNGVLGEIYTAKPLPIFLLEDHIFDVPDGDYESFLESINNKSRDPRKTSQLFKEEGKPVFLYSLEVMRYLKLAPTTFLEEEGRISPTQVLQELDAWLGDETWHLAGWGVKFFADALKAWTMRVGGSEALERLQDKITLDVLTLTDAMVLYRLARMFNPSLPYGSALYEVARTLEVQVSMDAESKLKALINIAGKLCGEGARNLSNR